MQIRKRPVRYNPAAYVRGGAPLAVARATQKLGFAQPGRMGVSVRPPVVPGRQRIIPPPPGARVPAAPVDPLWTQANNQVMQAMNPLLARLASQRVQAEANARGASAQHGQALGQALQATAKPMDESFQRGIVASGAVNDALANRLTQQGTQAQSDLSGKLAQIGAADTGEIQKTYNAASNTGFATGSADLQNLIGQKAAGAAYQAKQPGIGLLAGNQDLQQALGEIRGNFGEQEQSLTEGALDKSFGLWDKLRGEKREDTLNTQDALARQQESYRKEKLSLFALGVGAKTAAEKMRFAAQDKALDRENKLAIQNIKADTSMYGVDNKKFAPKNPLKPGAVTGPPTNPWISVNGAKVKNPNWQGTWKGNTPIQPPKGRGGGGGPEAPSGSQTAVTYNEIVKRIVNQEGLIRSKFSGPKADARIYAEVKKGLRLRKINSNGPDGKYILNTVFDYLNRKKVNMPKVLNPQTGKEEYPGYISPDAWMSGYTPPTTGGK